MAKAISLLLPSTAEFLRRLGDRLRIARLRRRLSAKQVAERAGMSPMTLRSLERGGSGVTIGAYVAVMQVLGIEKDLDLLAQADPMGRELQDARLPAHGRKTARRSSAPVASPPSRARSAAVRVTVAPSSNTSAGEIGGVREPAENVKDWIEKSGFASSRVLADLIDPVARVSKKKH